jgi:hypothetical protein
MSHKVDRSREGAVTACTHLTESTYSTAAGRPGACLVSFTAGQSRFSVGGMITFTDLAPRPVILPSRSAVGCGQWPVAAYLACFKRLMPDERRTGLLAD